MGKARETHGRREKGRWVGEGKIYIDLYVCIREKKFSVVICSLKLFTCKLLLLTLRVVFV